MCELLDQKVEVQGAREERSPLSASHNSVAGGMPVCTAPNAQWFPASWCSHREQGGVGGSVHLHVVLLDELEEAEGVRELQADGATVKGGGSLPQHLLTPVLAEPGHQLWQQTTGDSRVRDSCLM